MIIFSTDDLLTIRAATKSIDEMKNATHSSPFSCKVLIEFKTVKDCLCILDNTRLIINCFSALPSQFSLG